LGALLPPTLYLIALSRALVQRLKPAAMLLTCLLYSLSSLSASALPSCSLSNWLTELNAASNSYIAKLGTSHEIGAIRSFRHEMERHPRERLLEHISAADLGTNKDAVLSFIAARHHLLELALNNWPEEALRFGQNDLFIKQSQGLADFVSQTQCLSNPKFDLNASTHSQYNGTLTEKLKAIFIAPPPIALKSQQDYAATFDPDNFDAFKLGQKSHIAPKPFGQRIPRLIAVLAGTFTFVTAGTAWILLRRARIRSNRDGESDTQMSAPEAPKDDTAFKFDCNFPVYLFDGAAPQLARCVQISPSQATVICTGPLAPASKLLIHFGDNKSARPKFSSKRTVKIIDVESGTLTVSIRPALHPDLIDHLKGTFSRMFQDMWRDSLTEEITLELFCDAMRHTYGATQAMSEAYAAMHISSETKLHEDAIDVTTVNGETKNGAPKDAA
jgi:hypothetical protein